MTCFISMHNLNQFDIIHYIVGTSLVAQTVKNLPAMQEIQVWTLGQEDPLEKGMATHSSILASRIPWTEEAGRLQSMGLQTVRHNWVTSTFIFYFHYIVQTYLFHLTMHQKCASENSKSSSHLFTKVVLYIYYASHTCG